MYRKDDILVRSVNGLDQTYHADLRTKSFECTFIHTVVSNGNKELECFWSDGKLDGVCARWFEHGMQEYSREFK